MSVFILGFPATPHSDPVPLLHWTDSNLQKWRQQVWGISLSHILTPDMLSSRGESAQGHWLVLVPSARWAGVTALLAGCVCRAQGHGFCWQFCMCTIGRCTHYIIPPLKPPGPRFLFFILYYAQLSEEWSILFLFYLRNTFQLFIWIKLPLYCVPRFLRKQLMCSSRYAGFKGIYFISHTLETAAGVKEWEVCQLLLQWELIMPEWDYFFVW